MSTRSSLPYLLYLNYLTSPSSNPSASLISHAIIPWIIPCSGLITHPPIDLSDLFDSYNTTLSALLDKRAPLKSKSIHVKPLNPCFTAALSKLESARRWLESIWFHIRSSHDLKFLHCHQLISLCHYPCQKVSNSILISSSSSDPRMLWNSINKVLHRKSILHLPSTIGSKSLPSMFVSVFPDKVLKIHSFLKSHVTNGPLHLTQNLVMSQRISHSLVVLLKKTFASLYLSHPTPSVTLILYLLLFWISSYLHFSLP